jgi:hypothetical protein
MILTTCLNNANLGKVVNYFEPVDSIELQDIGENIIIEDIQTEELEINETTDTILVEEQEVEIEIEELENNVEVDCSC